MAIITNQQSRDIPKPSAFKFKSRLLFYFRFERQMVAVDELFFMDVAALSESDLIEVEVKISKGDLLRERKKKISKHNFIKAESGPSLLHNSDPTKYYFAVPDSLEAVAREEIEAINPNYGLIVFVENWNPVVVKPAKRLTERKIDYAELLKYFAFRASAKLQTIYSQMLDKGVAK